MSRSKRIYKIVFQAQGQIVELFARHVGQGALFGFVEVEDLLFGTRSELVVDPTEEGLRNEYGGAKRLFLPLHTVVRIEEVEKEGAPRLHAAKGGTVAPFPILLPVSRDPHSR